MIESQDIRHGRHTITDIYVYLVFVTKYRRNVLKDTYFPYLFEVCTKVCTDMDSTLLELDGEDDHIHLLIKYPPHVAISTLVNSLKGVSSRMLRRKYPEITDRLYKNHLWSPSYFAVSSGGAPLEKIREYIQNQRK